MNETEGRKKRIALVQTQAEAAGAQEISRLLAQDLAHDGWTVRQIFLYRRTASFDHQSDVVFCAPQRPSSPAALMQCLTSLRRELREFKPLAVIAFQHYGNILAGLAARASRVPHVVASQVSAVDVVSKPVQLADRILGSIGLYDAIVVNSAKTEAFYRTYPASYQRRLNRIDHGFADKSAVVSKTEARRALGLPVEGVLLGCAARLHPKKQIELAVKLLAERPEWRLALAGQGADQHRLEDVARALGVSSRVSFLGELAPERISIFLAALNCFVFPSAAETFGLAAVEAAHAGVPVVANHLEVLKDVLAADGEPCALFVDAEDAHAFSTAVQRILADQKLADDLRCAGRKLGARYPRGAMTDGYRRIIGELEGSRHAHRICI